MLPSPSASPEKPFPLLNESPPVKTVEKWPEGSSELLTGLTDDNRKLVGYMVPWDSWVYQQLFNPAIGGTKVISRLFSIFSSETSVKSALQAGTVLVAIASRTILATKFANPLATLFYSRLNNNRFEAKISNLIGC